MNIKIIRVRQGRIEGFDVAVALNVWLLGVISGLGIAIAIGQGVLN